MAWEFPLINAGDKTAAANYSSASSQFTVVRSTGTNFTKQTTKGGVALGVLQDLPSSGQPGAIMYQGVSRVRVNTTAHPKINVGDKLRASTRAGVEGSTANVVYYVLGRALDSLSSNSTGIIPMLITHQGGGSSGIASAP
ncbi:MAG TPA: hypothetical protein VF923_09890 [Gemmatimonadales bacterium]